MELAKVLSYSKTSVCLNKRQCVYCITCCVRCTTREYFRSSTLFDLDLPTSVSTSTLLLFADDTKCVHPVSVPSDCLSLQYDIYQLSSWCDKWNLHFNEDKCVVMHLTTSRHVPIISDYHLNNTTLGTKVFHRDLRIIISEDLTWKEHHNHIILKAYKILGLLRRTFCNVYCVQAKKLLYLSLVRSQFMYCSPVWCPHFIKDILPIETVQRRATKCILNDFSSDYKSRGREPGGGAGGA